MFIHAYKQNEYNDNTLVNIHLLDKTSERHVHKVNYVVLFRIMTSVLWFTCINVVTDDVCNTAAVSLYFNVPGKNIEFKYGPENIKKNKTLVTVSIEAFYIYRWVRFSVSLHFQVSLKYIESKYGPENLEKNETFVTVSIVAFYIYR